MAGCSSSYVPEELSTLLFWVKGSPLLKFKATCMHGYVALCIILRQPY